MSPAQPPSVVSRGLHFYEADIGKKVVMAVTGCILFLFVVGNLQIYLGPETLNDYAMALRHLGAGLWVIRAGLLLIRTS